MYARLATMHLGHGMLPNAETMADEAVDRFKAQPGFVGVTLLADDEVGDYASLSLWTSKGAAVSAAENLRAGLTKALRDKAKAPPTVRLFEAYEPNA